ncbi:hypothetical protein AVEN_58588-1 [Araneus ventricosus]|uniref:Uncharacterized protein n=1 Tax=Araneus ventricosus TaxID=182803 RepID=A0A4Y2GXP5_ARAVE|nr:hypothetical protein AVEN_58588-1 [Araneus ventricosus]
MSSLVMSPYRSETVETNSQIKVGHSRLLHAKTDRQRSELEWYGAEGWKISNLPPGHSRALRSTPFGARYSKNRRQCQNPMRIGLAWSKCLDFHPARFPFGFVGHKAKIRS